MEASYVEHRPHASSEHVPTSHYTVVINGVDHGSFSTQSAAKDYACKSGHHPVHVARQRHLRDKGNPAHWKVDPC